MLHHCDNRACCNPGHLFLGTGIDNRLDCVAKGRHSRGDAHYSRAKPELLRPAYGEGHWGVILTSKKVTKIRALYVGGRSQAWLARRYGVSRGLIWAVIHRRLWKHLS